MDENTKFDYYYGIEADQFSFYRVPRLLIKDERFKGLSSDAKLLYGLMLDRMSLSMKNGWLDEENMYRIQWPHPSFPCASAPYLNSKTAGHSGHYPVPFSVLA